jgi:hypothetical protein
MQLSQRPYPGRMGRPQVLNSRSSNFPCSGAGPRGDSHQARPPRRFLPHAALLPLRTSDYWGFCWEGSYWVECFVPFGLRTASYNFDLFAKALHWILDSQATPEFEIIHYLDDFLKVSSAKTTMSSHRRGGSVFYHVETGSLSSPLLAQPFFSGPTHPAMMASLAFPVLSLARRSRSRSPQPRQQPRQQPRRRTT